MKKSFFFALVCLLFSDFFFCQEITEDENQVNKNILSKEISIVSMEKEIEVLKVRIEACNNYFDKINSTYQWSFGIVFTVIVAFLGITGFNYHRNNKKELDEIRETLNKDYQIKINEMQTINDKRISDKINVIEKVLKGQIVEQKLEFLRYQFNNEKIDSIKLSLALKNLITLSDANFGYTDWLFNDYITFIIDCCNKQIKKKFIRKTIIYFSFPICNHIDIT